MIRDDIDGDGRQWDNVLRGDSMFKINPYRPGAGLMPTYLAGRDEDIRSIENLFDALTLNIPTQSVIFSGLRGVGKTVLINRLQNIAEDKGIFCRTVEEWIGCLSASEKRLRRCKMGTKTEHKRLSFTWLC